MLLRPLRVSLSAVALLLLPAAACGEDADPHRGEAGSGGDEVGGAGGAGGAGGGNVVVNCGNAPVMGAGTSVELAFDEPGAHAYRRVALAPNTWYTMFIEPGSGKAVAPDVVLMAKTTDGELLASADDDRYNSTLQGLLFFFSGEGGDHCVDVTDYGTWTGTPPSSVTDPVLLSVFPADTFSFVDQEEEPNDSFSDPQVVVATSVVLGHHETANDVDVYEVPVGVDHDIVGVTIPPMGPGAPGTDGYGGLGLSRMSLWSADGLTLLGRIDDPVAHMKACAAGYCGFISPKPPGDDSVLLVFEGPATANPNARYVAMPYSHPFVDTVESSVDATEDYNDTPGTAQPLLMTTQVQRLFADLEPGDEDWWQVGVPGAPSPIEVVCYAKTKGSAVEGFTIEAYSATGPFDTPLQSQAEQADQFILWTDDNIHASFPALPSGEYLLRVTAQGFDPEIADHGYVCQFRQNQQL